MVKTLDHIFSHELTRREFLIKAGVLLLLLTGISGFWKTVTTTFSPKSKATQGYGFTPYGK